MWITIMADGTLPKLVSIESPYSHPDPEQLNKHINYVIMCCKHASKFHHEVPYASHMIQTQVVNDHEHAYVDDAHPDKYGIGREAAIELTHAARRRCNTIVFYTDLGWSPGMLQTLEWARSRSLPMEERTLPKEMLDEC